MTTPRAATALALLLVFLAISSCGTSEANGTVVTVRAERGAGLIASADYVVLDLRSSGEYAAGHVAGAVSLPADNPGFEARAAALAPGGRYLVYARTREASAPLADRLVGLGLARVVDAGAFGALVIAGAPVADGTADRP
jgi:phage shock protein E